MIYILLGLACFIFGYGLGYFIKIKWGHRDNYDGTLLVNLKEWKANLNTNKDLSELENDDILCIQVKITDADVLVKESDNELDTIL